MDNQTILITGANGFIAKAMSAYIKTISPKVTLLFLDRHGAEGQDQNVYVSAMQNPAQLISILKTRKPQIIFHLARGRQEDQRPLPANQKGILENLLEAVQATAHHARPRVIVPGSAAEYGECPPEWAGLDETSPLNPKNDYGQLKCRQVRCALDFAAQGLDVLVGRIFNILGTGTPPQLAAGRFAQQMVAAERDPTQRQIQTYGLAAQRDFLDIQDVCAALWSIACQGRTGEVYNICSGQGVSMRSLLEKMIQCAHLKDIHITEQIDSGKGIRRSVGDNQKIKCQTDWTPQVLFETSILNTLNSYRDHYAHPHRA